MKAHVLALAIAAASGAASAQTPASTMGTSHEVQSSNDKTHDVSVVDFEKDSARLTTGGEDTLRKAVDEAKALGKIDSIHVAVWSDKAFPHKSRKDLPKADRDLAKRRGQAIADYVEKDLKAGGVTIYNMAHGTTWLAKIFKTEDAEIKKVFAGEHTKLPKRMLFDLEAFRDQGKPSAAVVVVRHDQSKVAH